VVGFSFGAFWALWLAEQRPDWLRSVTLFYGTNGGSGDFSRSTAAFQGHFAAEDPYEPEELARAMETTLRAAGRPVSFYTYPGTGHWFFESDRPDAYHEPSARLAWERTLAFLRQAQG
jgi:carboxymethylenebutenolidase